MQPMDNFGKTDRLGTERIKSRNGLLTIDHAAAIGLGAKAYKLVWL
jgi:uncharacterized Fe-S center protein